MKQIPRIGVLAYHGDVPEHLNALENAARRIKKKVTILSVRSREDIKALDGLVIPGGESTTLTKLAKRDGLWEEMKKIPNVFGTCAGAIMLSKRLKNEAKGQETLELMNIETERNAYGSQNDSFEADIETELGAMHAVFIRAPKIRKTGPNVRVLATYDGSVLACEELKGKKYYLALAFHPELTTSAFHEYFLKKVFKK